MHVAAFRLPLTLCCLSLGVTAMAATRTADLDGWFTSDLTPYAADQLATHPRFRNESLRFVVLNGSNPQPVASALALSLRDRLQAALMDTPGIRIPWQSERADLGPRTGHSPPDCAADDVHYYIGLEITESSNGDFEVSLRALDLEERSWVAGFSRTWRGPLTAAQYRAWREVGTDQSFLGDRDVPFAQSQADLLAAQLARKLACSLLRQVSGEYVAASDIDDSEQGMVLELVGNNLAAYNALQLTSTDDEANSLLEAKAHRIDDDLYQYWVTVRPREPSSELPSLSASAYIYLQPGYTAIERVPDRPVAPALDSNATLLTSVKLVQQENVRDCAGVRDCFALLAEAHDDAVLFFLGYQPNHGLVRLASQGCDRRPAARIVRANETVRFTIPAEYLGSGSWQLATRWDPDPTTDTYYVVAAGDTGAARALARHVEQLPRRCTASVRQGLDGEALRRWMTGLEAINTQFSPQIDWQVIHVKELY